MPELTIRQFAQIVLGKTETPLHLGDILSANDEKVMMLKSTMANLSKAQAFMFVTMLCPADVVNILGTTPSDVSRFRASLAENDWGTFADWVGAWLNGNISPPASYGTLNSVLKGIGASIFYLSPRIAVTPVTIVGQGFTEQGLTSIQPWTVIGIVGPFGALANLSSQILPFWPGDWADQDWDALTTFASSGNALLLAPAELIPSILLAAQVSVKSVPFANMIFLPGG